MDLVQRTNSALSASSGRSSQKLFVNGCSINGNLNGNDTDLKQNGNHVDDNSNHVVDTDIERLVLPKYQDLVGHTALIDLTELAQPCAPGVRLLAKCEFLNPGFSMKDRIVKNILDKAEASGKLKAGGTVIAASSGNTGAALAMMAAMRGYNAVITTSSKCSKEKMDTIKAYGATLIVAPSVPEHHPDNYMRLATRLAAENPEWVDVDQYENPANPEAHYCTLGPEIWRQTKGLVTHFVAGSSTGGTLSGTARFLKECRPDIRVTLADPIGSILYEAFTTGRRVKAEPFLVEGVGKDEVPGCMDLKMVDQVVRVEDEQAFAMCHKLAATQGLMVGGSTGLNVFAAVQVARGLEEPGVVVTVLCDLGVKYLTKIFNDQWLEENNVELHSHSL